MLALIKRAGVTILISDKVYFRTNKIIRNTEGHYMIKGLILKANITILNVYALNNRASK